MLHGALVDVLVELSKSRPSRRLTSRQAALQANRISKATPAPRLPGAKQPSFGSLVRGLVEPVGRLAVNSPVGLLAQALGAPHVAPPSPEELAVALAMVFPGPKGSRLIPLSAERAARMAGRGGDTAGMHPAAVARVFRRDRFLQDQISRKKSLESLDREMSGRMGNVYDQTLTQVKSRWGLDTKDNPTRVMRTLEKRADTLESIQGPSVTVIALRRDAQRVRDRARTSVNVSRELSPLSEILERQLLHDWMRYLGGRQGAIRTPRFGLGMLAEEWKVRPRDLPGRN